MLPIIVLCCITHCTSAQFCGSLSWSRLQLRYRCEVFACILRQSTIDVLWKPSRSILWKSLGRCFRSYFTHHSQTEGHTCVTSSNLHLSSLNLHCHLWSNQPFSTHHYTDYTNSCSGNPVEVVPTRHFYYSDSTILCMWSVELGTD